MKIIIFQPAKPAYHISMDEYIHLLQCVPEGRIVRRSDIDRYLCKKYQTDSVEIEIKPLFFNPLWDGIPYWREVSEKGYLWKNHRIFSTDVQKRKLEEEGLHVIPCGMNQESLRVENYKDYVYKYDDIEDI